MVPSQNTLHSVKREGVGAAKREYARILEMSAKENVTNKASNPRDESGMSATSSAVSASNVLSANTEREISKLSAETTDSHKNISRPLEENCPPCVVTVLGLALQPGGVASNQVLKTRLKRET